MAQNRNAAQRLEQALGMWENINFILRITAETNGAKGYDNLEMEDVFLHADELREELLKCYEQTPDFDLLSNRFYGITDNYFNTMGHLANLPVALLSWTASSRRVYSLPNNLQTLLEWTSLDELKWSDIEWPLSSFCIRLERPLVDYDGKRYDFLLFARYDSIAEDGAEESNATVMLFSDLYDGYYAFTAAERNGIRMAVKKKKKKELLRIYGNRRLVEPGSWATSPIKSFNFSISENEGAMIKDRAISFYCKESQEKVPANYHDVTDAAIHIIVGLVLYLDSLEEGESEKLVWKKPPYDKTKNLRHIDNAAQICDVLCVTKLSQRDHDFLAAVNEFVRINGHMGMPVHWRRGHWRRPWGTRGIPGSKKTKRISPILVNAALIDEFLEAGVPVGASHAF
ncbi:hypothetical protein HGA64_03415 [Candidatus Falkowbacteria bacterium]|nr:hypothetical protein [Candidatus Falkowbacteria bacterium]